MVKPAIRRAGEGDRATVERASENLRKVVGDGVIEVEDVVVLIRNEDGTFDVQQGRTGTAAMAVGEACLGARSA